MDPEERQKVAKELENAPKKPELGLNPERIYEGPALDFDLTPIFLQGERGSEDSTRSNSPALNSPLSHLPQPSA